MHITRFQLTNFRGFRELDLRCREKSVVLFGKNGAGKTTILEGIANALACFVSDVNKSGNLRTFDDRDVTYKKLHSEIAIEMDLHDKDLEWKVRKKFRGDVKTEGTDHVQYISDWINFVIDENYEKGFESSVPIIVFYAVDRVVQGVPLSVHEEHDFSIQDIVYEEALTSGADFRTFFEWYRNREDIENETKIREGLEYRDLQLEAVRQAIYKLLPDFKKLRISRTPLRMLIDKKGITLEINQLSHGEKCLLALVGDLARRLAIANPGMDNPLHGEGIVLIDEIELHLHPSWQRKVISGLRNAFPHVQFIITTHSPQVISEVADMKLYVLQYTEQGNTIEPIDTAFGQDVNYVLEELMEVPRRNQEIQELIDDLFRKIEVGDWDAVDEIRGTLKTKVQYDEVPELLRADLIMKRRRGAAR